ncbi:hypothetical protein NHP190012_10280 [Helicobacter sp. NHP19-012]|uniref:Restriction endonuclease n=1 Tax=Helicobacter gastrofelis TaxID=2849642 RepID=A0ABN6I797_9HELI|nr:McrC family protein [Helicobacter sp. NHP19-012]BCZ19386.1 hypothetical protein NHP190012_10280 [Helicobacter sp. NHP19-012]
MLYNCLATLKNTPFKQNRFSNLEDAKLPLLDVFIQAFLQECQTLIKRGLKRDYLNISQNRPYLKGKLEFSTHLQKNLIHKERFYTSSDEYSLDVAPNRLIKAVLELFKTLSLSPKNQEGLNAASFVFDEVKPSKDKDIDTDFSKSTQASRFKEYENLLTWCDLFLRQKSLAPYSGASRAYALLFPMERLFEDFVGFWVQKSGGYQVTLQKQNRKYLMCYGATCDNLNNCFEMRPDIVLREETKITILDTKWKALNAQKDIAHADLYQMWAYASKYATCTPAKEVCVWLVYPQQETQKIQDLTFKPKVVGGKEIELLIKFFPL